MLGPEGADQSSKRELNEHLDSADKQRILEVVVVLREHPFVVD